MDYQPSYGFLKDCLYRSESYKVTLADAYTARQEGHGEPDSYFLVGGDQRHTKKGSRSYPFSWSVLRLQS